MLILRDYVLGPNWPKWVLNVVIEVLNFLGGIPPQMAVFIDSYFPTSPFPTPN